MVHFIFLTYRLLLCQFLGLNQMSIFGFAREWHLSLVFLTGLLSWILVNILTELVRLAKFFNYWLAWVQLFWNNKWIGGVLSQVRSSVIMNLLWRLLSLSKTEACSISFGRHLMIFILVQNHWRSWCLSTSIVIISLHWRTLISSSTVVGGCDRNFAQLIF